MRFVLILLLNPFREVPLLERPPLEVDLLREAEAFAVRILTSVELVQAHHSLHLEDDSHKAFASLSLRRLDEGEVPGLTTTVQELFERLRRQLQRIVAARGWLEQSPQILKPSLQLSVENLYRKSGQALPSALGPALETFGEVHQSVLRGESIRKARLAQAVGCGLGLLRNLQSFPRGIYTVVEPGLELFSDPEALHRRTEVTGVLIEVSGADVPSLRVFPTTRTYERGQELSWEWNPKKVCGETWYRAPDGQVQYAWTDSMEFVGRPLSEL